MIRSGIFGKLNNGGGKCDPFFKNGTDAGISFVFVGAVAAFRIVPFHNCSLTLTRSLLSSVDILGKSMPRAFSFSFC